MMRAPLLLAILLILAIPGVAQDHEVTINVVSADNLGCSDDWTGADLRVSVFVEEELVLRTIKAADDDAPLFGEWTRAKVPDGASIRIVVEEAEPGVFFIGTAWETCDAAPGPGREFLARYDGGVQAFDAVGQGNRAAAALVVIGHTAPPPAHVLIEPESDHARISWDGHADWTGHHLAWTSGEALHGSGGAAGDVTLGALCDGLSYYAKLVRYADDWAIGAHVRFETTDVPPGQPTVLSASRDEVRWWSPTVHDISRYAVHAGPAGFEVRPDNRVASVAGEGEHDHSADVRLDTGVEEVRVVSRDQGGHESVSEPLALSMSQTRPAADACDETGTFNDVRPTFGGSDATAPADGDSDGNQTASGDAPDTADDGSGTGSNDGADDAGNESAGDEPNTSGDGESADSADAGSNSGGGASNTDSDTHSNGESDGDAAAGQQSTSGTVEGGREPLLQGLPLLLAALAIILVAVVVLAVLGLVVTAPRRR